MKDFRSLMVWEKAHLLVLDIYRHLPSFPKEERYGLVDQIRRAAVSIPANIAEGCGRGSDTNIARILQIAMGSASELDYELLLSKDLGFLSKENQVELEPKNPGGKANVNLPFYKAES
jgi:four helix bundle protein